MSGVDAALWLSGGVLRASGSERRAAQFNDHRRTPRNAQLERLRPKNETSDATAGGANTMPCVLEVADCRCDVASEEDVARVHGQTQRPPLTSGVRDTEPDVL